MNIYSFPLYLKSEILLRIITNYTVYISFCEEEILFTFVQQVTVNADLVAEVVPTKRAKRCRKIYTVLSLRFFSFISTPPLFFG